jgi:hypothetical protein
VFYCQPSGIRRGSGRECWDGSVTVISIQLCVLLSAECKQEGPGRKCWGGSDNDIENDNDNDNYNDNNNDIDNDNDNDNDKNNDTMTMTQ